VSARLELYVQQNANNWGTEGGTVDAHRIATSWSEAAATWNCPSDSNPSNSTADCPVQWAGASFEANPTDTLLHTNGLQGWVGFDVTRDVESFLSGTANYGWLLKKTDEGQSGEAEYTSREGTASSGCVCVAIVAGGYRQRREGLTPTNGRCGRRAAGGHDVRNLAVIDAQQR